MALERFFKLSRRLCFHSSDNLTSLFRFYLSHAAVEKAVLHEKLEPVQSLDRGLTTTSNRNYLFGVSCTIIQIHVCLEILPFEKVVLWEV